MANNPYDELLQQYRSIWNNRLLAQNASSEEILKEAICRELKDENSHPRIRQSVYEKFFSAIKRLQKSNISEEAKIQLLGLHVELMDKIIIEINS